VEAQLPQPEAPAEVVTWGAPPALVDLDTNPQVDMRRPKS